MGVTPAGRTLVPRAPEKGVFPLDHFGECKEARAPRPTHCGAAPQQPAHAPRAQAMAAYMACLKDASYATEGCRHLSKRYLECRMSRRAAAVARCGAQALTSGRLRRGLMAEEDLSKLGFTPGEAAQQAAKQQAAKAAEDARATEKAGFVAGLRPIAVAEATAQARKSS